jgi:hypothetical protein
MATDVIIDPANGQIYWNDGTGSPQSISLGGNAQDTISVTGYSNVFSPGSTPSASAAGVLLKFTDSATGTLTPGTSAYELGSGSLRWKFYGTTTNISDNSSALGTNTFSLLTGLVQINGGIAISGNASIGQTLFYFNPTDSRYFVGFRSSASLASTQIYTLPLTYPSTGSSVLQSDTAGTLTWVPMTASSSGGGVTAQNINIVSATTGTFYPLFSNTSTTASGTAGIAVSVDANLSFEASGNSLSVGSLTLGGNGLTSTLANFELGNTSSIAQTFIFGSGTGAFRYNFGTSSASASTATFFGAVTANYLIFNTGSGGVLRIQTDQVNSRIRMFENMTTGTLGFFGTSGGTLYLGTDSGTSNGDITLRGNYTNGGGGNQRAAIFTLATATSNGTGVGGTMVFQTSTSTTAGSASNALRTRLRIEGAATGTSNLESIIILGEDASGTAFTSTIRGSDATGTNVTAGELIIQAARSTGTGTMAGICFNVASPGGSGSALNSVVDVGHFYSVQDSVSTTSGSFVLRGGIGISGNAFIGGTVVITSTNNSTSTGSGALVVSGGAGVAGTLIVGGTIASIGASIYGVVYTNSIQIGQGGNNINFLDSSGNTLGNFNTSNGWFRSAQTTNSSSTSTGALVSAGGLGIAGNAFIGGTTNITNSTSSTNSGTGALVVTGGLGLVGNAFIGGTFNVTNSTSSINSGTGALVVTGGLGLVGNAFIGGTTTISNSTSSVGGSSGAFVVYGGTNIGGNAFIGGTTNITSLSASGTTASGALVVSGGVGIGGSVNIGKSLNLWNPAYTFSTNLASGAATSTITYILPPGPPNGLGTSVLSSSNAGVLSWIPQSSGGSATAPGGSDTAIQFNDASSFGGTSGGFSFTKATHTVSIGSTNQTNLTAIGLQLYNNNASSISGTVKWSPAMEFMGRSWLTVPGTDYRVRFINELQAFTNQYSQRLVWRFSYDTGTASYTNPIMILNSQLGVGIGASDQTAVSYFRAGNQSSTDLSYTLPTAYPTGTATSYLSASTTGVMAWVAAPSGGGGTPGGSNKQIQYNSSSSFGGASGFEYVTGGIANTVSIFSASGTGYTAGVWINAINGSTTRVGIGLSNPQFELEINGEISATNKSFVIDHPTKSGMKLRYGSLEGPENGVYVRGELKGNNIIQTPDHWTGLVDPDSFTVTLTPIGEFSQLYVEKIENYKVYVGNTSPTNIHCFYTVWAERKDIPKLVTEY